MEKKLSDTIHRIQIMIKTGKCLHNIQIEKQQVHFRDGIQCFVATRKILGFYISVVHSFQTKRPKLRTFSTPLFRKEGWDSVTQN